MKVISDNAYLQHNGKPLVAIWGIGFSDDRKYTLQETFELVQWLKSEGCSVMLGVPTFWREGTRDAVDDPMLHDIIRAADIVSPWTVGRYGTPKQAAQHINTVGKADLAWSQEANVDYLPVVFPGFSWHNLNGSPVAQIPRQQGKFFWSQIVAAKRIGCNMIYVAMFDEVDEGTAIFKCTNDLPVGEGIQFLDFEGLPSDFYLRLTGHAAEVLRGEAELTDSLPSLRR